MLSQMKPSPKYEMEEYTAFGYLGHIFSPRSIQGSVSHMSPHGVSMARRMARKTKASSMRRKLRTCIDFWKSLTCVSGKQR
jgi:hypothetical protein